MAPLAEVVLAEDRPAREELLSLYGSVGWTAYTSDPDLLEAAVAGSSYVVTARAGGELVGLARAVSDDASICFLADLLIRADWQRRGLGRRLAAAVLDRFGHVRRHILLADADPALGAFYRALGFEEISSRGAGALRAYIQLGTSQPSADH
jgi:GNAT superfamily N-acetyltransferase